MDVRGVIAKAAVASEVITYREADRLADAVLEALLDNGYAVVSSTSPAGSEGPKGPGDTVSATNDALCRKRRGPRGRVRCEKPAGHFDEHAARGRDGRWFFWAVS